MFLGYNIAIIIKKRESYCMNEKIISKRVLRLISVLGITITILAILYGYQKGIFTSTAKLQAVVKEVGIWGPLLFIGIQIVQVVVPIIPGGVTCVAGVVIFGPLEGFLYNYIGIVIGSILNFALARSYGQTFIRSMVSERLYEKYIGWLSKGERFDKLFALAIFFPVAPDDFLCMLAGLTKMTYMKFTTIILLGKPAALLAYSFSLTAMLQFVTRYIVK